MIEETIGYPVAVKAAGGGGGKGFRVALTEDKLKDAFEGAAREGEKFFSDATRLPRALPTGSPPRRGPGARRQARQRDPPRRARLLDPAPPPEADRGGPGAGGRRRAARQDRQDRHRGRRGGRLHRSRHGRGAAPGRRVLLPGDEHPRPGRAPGDRAGDRHRHRQGGDPGRRRRAAVDLPGRGRAPRPRDRMPDQRRGREQELLSRARHDRRLPRADRPRRAR